MAQGGAQAQELRQRLEQEKNNRIQQREQVIQQIQQIQQMELGTEVPNMNVETTVDVRVGDDWSKYCAVQKSSLRTVSSMKFVAVASRCNIGLHAAVLISNGVTTSIV